MVRVNWLIDRLLVVDDDARIAFAVGRDQLRELRQRAAFGDRSLRQQLPLHVRARHRLPDALGDFFDNILRRSGGRQQTDPGARAVA